MTQLLRNSREISKKKNFFYLSLFIKLAFQNPKCLYVAVLIFNINPIIHFYAKSLQKFFKKITPLFDRVLVEKVAPVRTTTGGIVLPETMTQKSNEGKVVAAGKGKRLPDGKFVPLTVQVGDTVLLTEHYGNDLKINGKDYILIREEDILGVIEETDQLLKNENQHIPDVKDLP